MKKKDKKQKQKTAAPTNERRIVGADGAIDWTPLIGIAKSALHWAHHLAAELSRPDERDAIDRVFDGMPALLDGAPADVSLDDALHALRVVGRGVERDQRMWPGTFELVASMLALAFVPADAARGHAPRVVMPPVAHVPIHPSPSPSTSRALAELCALVFPLRAAASSRGALFHLHR